MTQVFVFTLAVFGVAFVIGHARISFPLRSMIAPHGEISPWRTWLITLLECPACTSWWGGALAVYIGIAPYAFGSGVPGMLFCAFYCCASSLLLAKLAGLDSD